MPTPQQSAPAPDLRRAVRASAAISVVALLAAGLSGIFASSGEVPALVHGICVALALPISFVGNLIAMVASARTSRSDAP
jgi:hypothetical protein